MAIKFPSVELFSELARRMKADPATFEKLGFCDTLMGVKVLGAGDPLYALRFEVFECAEVRELSSAQDAELDFTLEAPAEIWRAMFESIRKEGGTPSPRFSLNSLSHVGDQMKVVYDEPEGHDKFYRFMGTLQAFMDQSYDLDIEWA